jgi:hypothetical protein
MRHPTWSWWTGSSPQEVSNAPVRGFPCYWSPPYNLALVAGGYVMKPIRESCRWLLIAVLVLFAPALTEAHEASVTAEIENPAQYDGQTVTLRRTVAALKETVSRRSNDYTTFKLHDPSGGMVTVFKWGHSSLKDGDWVEVEGVFQRVKHVGADTFYNEVEAQSIWVRVVKRVPVPVPETLPSDSDHR